MAVSVSKGQGILLVLLATIVGGVYITFDSSRLTGQSGGTCPAEGEKAVGSMCYQNAGEPGTEVGANMCGMEGNNLKDGEECGPGVKKLCCGPGGGVPPEGCNEIMGEWVYSNWDEDGGDEMGLGCGNSMIGDMLTCTPEEPGSSKKICAEVACTSEMECGHDFMNAHQVDFCIRPSTAAAACIVCPYSEEYFQYAHNATDDGECEYMDGFGPPTPNCGNNNVEEGEQCDDGNTTDGDGCSASCTQETLGGDEGGDGDPDPICGDGNVDDGEECDDGNTDNNDGCDGVCKLECGNSKIDANEECDEGPNGGETCTGRCACKAPFSYSNTELKCVTLCGNGTKDVQEECDDGNRDAGDGCDSECLVETCDDWEEANSANLPDCARIPDDGCSGFSGQCELSGPCCRGDKVEQQPNIGCCSGYQCMNNECKQCASDADCAGKPARHPQGVTYAECVPEGDWDISLCREGSLEIGPCNCQVGMCRGNTTAAFCELTPLNLSSSSDSSESSEESSKSSEESSSEESSESSSSETSVSRSSQESSSFSSESESSEEESSSSSEELSSSQESSADSSEFSSEAISSEEIVFSSEISSEEESHSEEFSSAALESSFAEESSIQPECIEDDDCAAIECTPCLQSELGCNQVCTVESCTLQTCVPRDVSLPCHFSECGIAFASSEPLFEFPTLSSEPTLSVASSEPTFSLTSSEPNTENPEASSSFAFSVESSAPDPKLPRAPEPPPDFFCGDGFVDEGEMCDDGNRDYDDGCSGNCLLEPDPILPVAPQCGDGVLHVNEDCDDRNTASGDGCSKDCEIEPPQRERGMQCGDGIIEHPEKCDDGNTQRGDGCGRTCRLEPEIIEILEGDVPVVLAAEICGNGSLDPGEECDDRNTRSDDGCSAICLLEIGICGDGIIQRLLGEQCEGSTHDRSLSYECSNCLFVSKYCGDGKIDAGEECDDGSRNSTSPNANCRPSCHVARCGDGIWDDNEQCDDGNRLNDDGCDRRCRVEREEYEEYEEEDEYEYEEKIVAAETTTSAAVPTTYHLPPTTYPQYPQQFPNHLLAQQFGFPQIPNYQPLAPRLPLAQLQPLATRRAPIGDTGPAAVAVIGAGAASGLAWIRRKRK